MTIGEQLEEARSARHVSLREAAEATKIRSDYLQAMEDNAIGSIDLPEIYRRGFLRNYARFLKLDADKVVTDYHAKQLGQVMPASNTRPSFGRVELPPTEMDASEFTGKPRRLGEESTPETAPREPALGSGESELNLTLYIKIAVVLGSVLVLGVLLVLLINLLRGNGDAPEINPDLNRSTATETLGATPTIQGIENVTIRATATVSVIVKDTATGATLFSGTLEAGETTPPLEMISPLELRFSQGSAIEIVRGDGQVEFPGTSGVGRSRIE